MEIPLMSIEGKEKGKIALPKQFEEPIRPDLIKRAVEAILSNNRQPYGADPRAGKKAAAKLSRRRRRFKSSYGRGISRVPRKTLMRRGEQFLFVGAFAPGTVGGRRAHPPKAEKVFCQKINKVERRKAIRSALAATMSREHVASRGHKVFEKYPFAVVNDLEQLAETKKVYESLKALGFEEEFERTAVHRIRAGKGKARGRRLKKSCGLLIVVSGKCPLSRAARNIPGVDVIEARNLNAHLLAPGGKPGRLSLFTEGAIKAIAGGLFR
ncbi:MAG: 50S ribosomal protein L4 [Candidatus Woesearchaeota archaeon]